MRVVVSKHFTIPCVQYGPARIGCDVEFTEDDIDFDPEDDRDPVDIALERAIEAANGMIRAELEVLQEENVAEDPNHITKILKTL